MVWNHASQNAQASAEGRPTRRQVMVGLATAGIAPAPLLAAKPDPLLELIAEYRQQFAIYMAASKGLTKADDDALAAATYLPMWDRLWDDPPPPTTSKGAAEALRLARERIEEMTGGVEVALFSVVLAYLEGTE